MTTPILDFVRRYAEADGIRFHMPGHKGVSFLGCESLDITEVAGADVLYAPEGIIAESEANATALFGSAHTFYSAEGSTLCIKAMLAIVSAGKGDRPWILAARNAHKSLIYGAAMLDLRIRWLDGEEGAHLCRCDVTPDDVAAALSSMEEKPCAVYLTSPDYLGNLADVAGISAVCRKWGIPLLVDNAHGAYLKFLEPSLHPLDQGAAMCCDSAHKTLPVLTGGAYLHVAKGQEPYLSGARGALSLFASTSPSYLILQSLDACNRYLSEGYARRLSLCCQRIEMLRRALSELGFSVNQTEPLKLTVSPRSLGYTGDGLAAYLREKRIECEFSDSDALVLMITPENGQEDLDRLLSVLSALPKQAPLPQGDVCLRFCGKRTSENIRRAMLAPRKTISARDAEGCICATPTVSCPPAIPIAVSGDVITKEDIDLFLRYGIENVDVVEISYD
ncbi:MAG: amino acid decarboxylase [Clostridia bacterium]|nr:amino acid decarboxylase [Clostridia bacterium]